MERGKGQTGLCSIEGREFRGLMGNWREFD